MVGQGAAPSRRRERDQHAEDEAARSRIVENTDGNLPQSEEIDPEQRQDGGELDEYGEGLAEFIVGEAKKRCTRSRWPVDDTGRNSVRPSTRPRKKALSRSKMTGGKLRKGQLLQELLSSADSAICAPIALAAKTLFTHR